MLHQAWQEAGANAGANVRVRHAGRGFHPWRVVVATFAKCHRDLLATLQPGPGMGYSWDHSSAIQFVPMTGDCCWVEVRESALRGSLVPNLQKRALHIRIPGVYTN